MLTTENPEIRGQLVELLNINSFTTEEQDQIIQHLNELVSEKIFEFALDNLSDKDKDTLENISEDEDISGLVAFLKEKIPTYDEQVKTIVDDVVTKLKAF
ncbi:MAG: hypothetical protein V4519_03675 [Patescibacteria group bacterium]